jgi:hypothetical protein
MCLWWYCKKRWKAVVKMQIQVRLTECALVGHLNNGGLASYHRNVEPPETYIYVPHSL